MSHTVNEIKDAYRTCFTYEFIRPNAPMKYIKALVEDHDALQKTLDELKQAHTVLTHSADMRLATHARLAGQIHDLRQERVRLQDENCELRVQVEKLQGELKKARATGRVGIEVLRNGEPIEVQSVTTHIRHGVTSLDITALVTAEARPAHEITYMYGSKMVVRRLDPRAAQRLYPRDGASSMAYVVLHCDNVGSGGSSFSNMKDAV